MNPDEYRRGKYVWTEDEATDADPAEAVPQVEDAREGDAGEA